MDENENWRQKSIVDKTWHALATTGRYVLIFYVAVTAVWAIVMLFAWVTGSLPE
jgi:hypothetical protein